MCQQLFQHLQSSVYPKVAKQAICHTLSCLVEHQLNGLHIRSCGDPMKSAQSLVVH